MIADQPLATFRVEADAVESDDAGGFLAAMLQGVQAKGGNRGGVGMIEDPEDAALLAQPVAVRVEGPVRVAPSASRLGSRSEGSVLVDQGVKLLLVHAGAAVSPTLAGGFFGAGDGIAID